MEGNRELDSVEEGDEPSHNKLNHDRDLHANANIMETGSSSRSESNRLQKRTSLPTVLQISTSKFALGRKFSAQLNSPSNPYEPIAVSPLDVDLNKPRSWEPNKVTYSKSTAANLLVSVPNSHSKTSNATGNNNN
jgi:hypothetical protein